MVNPISQVISAFASLITILIAYTIFGPIINNILAGVVLSALAGNSGTPLETNAAALKLTVDLIIIGIKLFSWFVCFAVFVRLFVYLGFLTSEENTGVY